MGENHWHKPYRNSELRKECHSNHEEAGAWQDYQPCRPGITPNVSAYISSKMAVAGFTEAVSKELKQFNIQVNAISPSPVDTRMLEQVQKARKLAGEGILKGATPEKAVALAVYLASDESFVTGKVISAVWDAYSRFDEIKDKLENTSLYNFRRIDDIIFVEKDKS